jgi:DNA-binding transcriptional LysR family regulator
VESVLAAGRADLVLSTVRSTDETVHRQRLLDQPLRLALPAGHRLAERREVALTEAADEPFLMLRPKSPLRRLCLELCREAGFEPTVSFEGEDISTLRGFVAAGLGVAITPAAPEDWAEPGTGPLRYLRITDVPATREIGLVWAHDRRLLPAAELFREHVLTRARAHRLPAVP